MSINTKRLKLVKTKRPTQLKENTEPTTRPNNNNNDTSKATSHLKHIFIEWSSTVDINAYAKLFEYKSSSLFVQSIWLFILLVLTGATFWLISLSIADYLKVFKQISIHLNLVLILYMALI